MELDGLTIFMILFGFFTLCLLVFGITILVLWNRRKLLFTNFLDKSGKWERVSHKVIDKSFEYDGQVYKFDLLKCTRDWINRPIAHYYKGNPVQLDFEYAQKEQTIRIGSQEITSKDFRALMLTKIIKDIFTDDDSNLMAILILVGLFIVLVAVIAMPFISHQPVILDGGNETLNIIADGCRQALKVGR